MNLKDALQRIEELEKRVKELETRPIQQHFRFAPPYYAPLQVYPQPYNPCNPWYITTGQGTTLGADGGAFAATDLRITSGPES